jgi:MGT family glycosyltransferase
MTGLAPGRFLLACIDAGGTVPPVLGVAGRLVGHGHHVLVLGDPTVADSARAAGCSFTPWVTAPAVSSIQEQTALIKDMESGNALAQFRYARDRILFGPAQRFAYDVVATVRNHPVDAVLVDAVLPGALIGAEATGLPTAALMANVYVRPTPDRPQLGTGWAPAGGVVGRGRDRLVAAVMRRLLATGLPAINSARAAHGLTPIGDLYELLDRCARVLVMTSPSFDFVPSTLPGNVRYVGPELADPDWARTTETADWRPDGIGPLVLVAMSSVYQAQAEIMLRVARALGGMDVRAVLTTGRAIDPREVPATGKIRVVRAAPHRQVLTEASVVITHAGHGSVLKALAAGVPLVCMPQGRDQKDNTTRVLRLGAGVRISKRASEQQIAAAVRSVLDNPTYTQAAQRFAATLAIEAAGYPDATQETENLLTLPLTE